MCYPTPGPRCSNHAYKEFVDADVKFGRCNDPAEKLVLGEKLKEKLAVYESTPRGQHELRRNADAAEGIEREQLILKLKTAEASRKQQLEDYAYAVENRNTSFQELMADKGYKKGRYTDACGMALLYLNNRYKNKEFHLEKIDTIVSDRNKIFVVPAKYQETWGSYTYDGETYDADEAKLVEILEETANLSHPLPSVEKKMFEWFIRKLKDADYNAVAAVNRGTQDVALISFDDFSKLYSIGFKSRKRLGGTTNYSGDVETIENLIKDTVFENGTVIQPEKSSKTAIYGVLPQAQSECVLSDEIYLSWRDMDDGTDGYFEVRRRHVSKNFNVIVTLQAKKLVSVTGTSSHLELKP